VKSTVDAPQALTMEHDEPDAFKAIPVETVTSLEAQQPLEETDESNTSEALPVESTVDAPKHHPVKSTVGSTVNAFTATTTTAVPHTSASLTTEH
jgi:hypothetical protein